METFSGLMRLKHLGVRIITCGLTKGGSTYLITIAYTRRQVSCQIVCIFIGKRLSFSESDFRFIVRVLFSVQRVKKVLLMPKTSKASSSSRRGKARATQTAGNRKRRNAKHVESPETHEEAATCSAQDLREKALSEMRAIG